MLGAEALEHREERRAARRAQALDGRPERVLSPEGDRELVLEEAPRPVEAVPVAHCIQRVEERSQRLKASPLLAGRLAVPGLVEQSDREPGEEARWNPRWGAERVGGGLPHDAASLRRGQLGGGRVISPGEHGAPQPAAPGEAVDPGHRVAVAVVALVHPREQVVEVAGALEVDQHLAAGDGQQPQRRVEHDAGQPHPAGGRLERVRLVRARDRQQLARRRQQREREHVGAEAAVAVVVLAVDVAGDRAPDRHVAGPRRDRGEEAERQRRLREPRDRQAGADPEDAARQVDVVDAAEAVRRQHVAAGVLCRVAVAATEPAGDRSAGAGPPHQSAELRPLRGRVHGRPGGRGQPPAGQQPKVALPVPLCRRDPRFRGRRHGRRRAVARRLTRRRTQRRSPWRRGPRARRSTGAGGRARPRWPGPP